MIRKFILYIFLFFSISVGVLFFMSKIFCHMLERKDINVCDDEGDEFTYAENIIVDENSKKWREFSL